jgi:hypothetical protein
MFLKSPVNYLVETALMEKKIVKNLFTKWLQNKAITSLSNP